MKFVFTGCVGSGKTEAIKTVSDIPVISTEEKPSDDLEKQTTTVALDYGELHLAQGSKLELYGTPGQSRFAYMWKILSEGASGFIILVNHKRPSPVEDLDMYVENFAEYLTESNLAVGVTHTDDINLMTNELSKYYEYLKHKNISAPVLPIDPRDASSVTTLLQALTVSIEQNL
ncbi:MAG: ATP/GTP-binding protein [Gammaproteobacteria bacterium]|nr:ATP/GTP-binding protein [Gammaproteobacteria bacterium]